jgi:hypothetical protein
VDQVPRVVVLLLPVVENEKYEVWVTSSGITLISCLGESTKSVQKFKGGGGPTPHTWHGNIISILSFLKKGKWAKKDNNKLQMGLVTWHMCK